MRHESVLLKELVDGVVLDLQGLYVDVTFGAGGHSFELLSRLKEGGRLYGFDRDINELSKAREDERLVLRHNNFSDFGRVLRAEGVGLVDGVMADLGVSSMQFDESDRGFSYRSSAKLDMRMNRRAKMDAAEVLNTYSMEQLWYMFSDFGEIKNAKTLAGGIVAARALKSITLTGDLMLVAEQYSYGNKFRYLSQVFQAVRMEVNDEMGELYRFLSQLSDVVKVGGRVGIITFHSLEDRAVKRFFKTGSVEGQVKEDDYGRSLRPFKVVNKKPILPSAEEISQNVRSRSAKLRIAERIEIK
ncbi:16S rRNA (cytosine(1402)-N(4))-methyltransferase RsmH [Membranihabitans marinus]|uniref:16S rRNA (cytosine(1402)-N(4))-methyltransferase RsmH n=1 Tax=Membranihabitans marinus TaxID=1227546 RepID=UPI001F02515B|nr:16S rRNA (cytosine(1402)-N(4))-methyltransferase RsmH [Membranihabitans marinus]